MTKKLTASDLKDIRLALREGESLQDVVSHFVTDTSVAHFHRKGADIAPVPDTSMITPEVRDALKTLPRVFGKVVVEERRELQESEIGDIYAEYKTITTIGDTLAQRKDVLKENIRTHIDVQAESNEDVDEDDLDDSGHYLLPTKGNPVRVPIPNSNEQFSLEYRSGRAGKTSISSEALLDAYETGAITREQYLSLTREVRVFDEDKASKAVLADPSLLAVLRDASRRTGQTNPGTSLYLRKAK